MAYNSYDLANTSLVKTGNLTECYLPLWYYSSGSFSSNNTGNTSTAPSSMLAKGTTAIGGYGSGAQVKIHTLNSNWSPNQKFAIEVSAYSNGAPSFGGYINLYDFTLGNTISASQISISASSATVVRSAQFTLTPGHVYGVSAFSNNSSYYIYVNKVSLIAFLS